MRLAPIIAAALVSHAAFAQEPAATPPPAPTGAPAVTAAPAGTPLTPPPPSTGGQPAPESSVGIGGQAIALITPGDDPYGLAGLRRIEVALGAAQTGGAVSSSGWKRLIEQRVAAAGIEVNSGVNVPVLELQAHFAPTTEGMLYGRMTLSLMQPVQLTRDTDTRVRAATWSLTSIVATPNDPRLVAALIDGTVRSLTQSFLEAHADENPPAEPRRVRLIDRINPF